MKKIDKFGLCLEEYTNNKNNAQIYYNRAIGKSPEMEVSKALAKIVKKIIKKNQKVLDVGCACGHYYRSLKREIKNNFFYTGVDPYKIFLDKAKLANIAKKAQQYKEQYEKEHNRINNMSDDDIISEFTTAFN